MCLGSSSGLHPDLLLRTWVNVNQEGSFSLSIKKCVICPSVQNDVSESVHKHFILCNILNIEESREIPVHCQYKINLLIENYKN